MKKEGFWKKMEKIADSCQPRYKRAKSELVTDAIAAIFLHIEIRIIFGILITLGTFFGFFFARRVTLKPEEYGFEPGTLTIPFRKWPKIKGHRIYPIWLMVTIAIIII